MHIYAHPWYVADVVVTTKRALGETGANGVEIYHSNFHAKKPV